MVGNVTAGQPAVQQLGGAVLVQGEQALTDLMKCVLAMMRELHGNGCSPAPYGPLLSMIHTARRMSQTRQQLPVYVVAEAHSNGQGGADWISVAEAAAVLDWNTRRVQRLAQRLYGSGAAKRIGNAWALDWAALASAEEERKRRHGGH